MCGVTNSLKMGATDASFGGLRKSFSLLRVSKVGPCPRRSAPSCMSLNFISVAEFEDLSTPSTPTRTPNSGDSAWLFARTIAVEQRTNHNLRATSCSEITRSRPRGPTRSHSRTNKLLLLGSPAHSGRQVCDRLYRELFESAQAHLANSHGAFGSGTFGQPQQQPQTNSIFGGMAAPATASATPASGFGALLCHQRWDQRDLRLHTGGFGGGTGTFGGAKPAAGFGAFVGGTTTFGSGGTFGTTPSAPSGSGTTGTNLFGQPGSSTGTSTFGTSALFGASKPATTFGATSGKQKTSIPLPIPS
jgi:hypothetical protein